jgi:hypothetical protein
MRSNLQQFAFLHKRSASARHSVNALADRKSIRRRSMRLAGQRLPCLTLTIGTSDYEPVAHCKLR